MDTADTATEQTGCRLLDPDEPPPVSILNETGSAQVLLVGDHVSNRVPRALDSLGLATPVLGKHLAYDIGTRKLITHLSQYLDAPAVLAGYSRLVVDLNRSLEDPTVIPEVSDGIPIPGNRGLSRAQRAQRIHCFYTPYRTAIDHMLHRIRARGIVPAFISIHSFATRLATDRRHRPWQIGLMWDKDPRIPVPLLERLRAHPDNLTVGDNEPYWANMPPITPSTTTPRPPACRTYRSKPARTWSIPRTAPSVGRSSSRSLCATSSPIPVSTRSGKTDGRGRTLLHGRH